MIRVFIILLSFIFTNLCLAHSRWMVPSHTVISGNDSTSVALDMSISNDIFHPDNPYGGLTPSQLATGDSKASKKNGPVHPLAKIAQSTKLVVTAPNGEQSNNTPIVDFGRKSVANVVLSESGTYRFELTQNPIYFTSYSDETNAPGRIFGIDEKSMQQLPKNARNIEKTQLVNRVQSFVTRNDSSRKSIEPTGEGLELIFKTHPNDLFVNESSSMTLMLNGKALSDSEIKLVKGGTRYRNDRRVQNFRSNAKGEFSIHWREPGRYLLEVEQPQYKNDNSDVDVTIYTLYLFLEVFPE